jgi:hypothetical protein
VTCEDSDRTLFKLVHFLNRGGKKKIKEQKASSCRDFGMSLFLRFGEDPPFLSFPPSSRLSIHSSSCLSLVFLVPGKSHCFLLLLSLHLRTTSQQPTTKPQNRAVVITAWTPFRTLPRVDEEAELLAASSKGLPPPPNASGFDLATSLR